jgi:hypothetical protein
VNVRWEAIFEPYNEHRAHPKKFAQLPNTPSWSESFEENLSLTLEWLLREARDDVIRLSPTPIITPVMDSWYRAEFEEGRFFHICFKSEMLEFRHQYETQLEHLRRPSLYRGEQLAEALPIPPDQAVRIIESAVPRPSLPAYSEVSEALQIHLHRLLWSAWSCFGGDGWREEPKVPEVTDKDPMCRPLLYDEKPYSDWDRVWRKKCFKCQADLPPGLKMWVKLQHSALKDAQ